MIVHILEDYMKHIKNFVFFTLACLIYLSVFEYFFGMICPFRIMFGFSCPGCGMSRAIIALLHLDFMQAIHYHPLVICIPFIIFLFFRITSGMTKGTSKLLMVLVALFLTVYIIRIYIGSDVLTFDFSDGFLYQVFHTMIKYI